ncbi:uncharacterized protein BJ212DRAFT_1296961 [Suillus subaureus]|uniref:Uncharacterized protein n=1 Tax=Suillus subaureus TaxID=48587 RepID=A0A9P7EHP6_9AGAM|nr:uncharacterized protein BJ212DRAFT_1296961 [Suillus subaureus]KAG1821593.1 hypothetical protein BJ212DRAFT_1296961 [Suillus subaureus]
MSAHIGSLPRSSSPWSDDTPFVEREQTICSDFTCCGLSLRDLHSLVDHFEEAHVVVFDSAGNAVYPNPSPILRVLDQENEGPYMSFVLGYPAPRAPVAFLEPGSCFESVSRWSSPSISSEPISPIETSSEECLPQNSFAKVKSKPVRTGKRVHRPRQRKKDKTYNCPRPDCTKGLVKMRYRCRSSTASPRDSSAPKQTAQYPTLGIRGNSGSNLLLQTPVLQPMPEAAVLAYSVMYIY